MGKSIGQWGPGGHRAIRAAPVKEEPPHDYYHASAKSEGSRLPSSPRRELLEESPRRGGGSASTSRLPPGLRPGRKEPRSGGGGRAPASRSPPCLRYGGKGRRGAAPPPHVYHQVRDLEGGQRPRLTNTTGSATGVERGGEPRSPKRSGTTEGGLRSHLSPATMSATWWGVQWRGGAAPPPLGPQLTRDQVPPVTSRKPGGLCIHTDGWKLLAFQRPGSLAWLGIVSATRVSDKSRDS